MNLPARNEVLEQARARLGQTIGDGWQLYGVLGTGGTSTVYAAGRETTGEKAAIKILHAWLTASPSNAAERMVREAQAVTKIGHPAICAVLASGEHEGQPFVVFEWLEGKSLSDALAEGAVAPKVLWRALGDVLDALHAAHSTDIVHRDLKPANVFLLDDDRTVTAKLLDFGAARLESAQLDTITKDGGLIGTVPYMSPEQARGERVGPSSDLYALGAMIYRALRGRPPYFGATILETLHLVSNASMPTDDMLDGIPEPIADIIRRSLAPLPHERWLNAREMKEALLDVDEAVVAELVLPKRPKKREGAETLARSEGATERAPVPVVADFEGSKPTVLETVSVVPEEVPAAEAPPMPRPQFWRFAVAAWVAALVIGLVVFVLARDSEPSLESNPEPAVVAAEPPPTPPTPTATVAEPKVAAEPAPPAKRVTTRKKKRRRTRRRRTAPKKKKLEKKKTPKGMDDVLYREI